MRKLLLPLFIGFTAISAQAQITNGGFESWTKVLFFEHPFTGHADMSSNYDTYMDNGMLSVTQVQEDDNTVLRVENIMGSNSVMPGYFIFGKTPTDGLVFGGGNTLSDLSMTGISMDLKYDIREDSEGFIIVQFKEDDTPVGLGNYGPGTYFFPISGISDWSHTEFEFDFPIHPSTNRCVVGIASADLINNDMPYVLGSFVEVDNIAFIGSEDNIKGGDFETWYHIDPAYVPDNCVVELHPLSPNYAQSWDAYKGSSAAMLKTLQRDNGEMSVGYLLMGDENHVGEIIPTIAIEQNDALSFAYSYSATDDLAEATFKFFDEASDFEQVFEETFQLTPNADYEVVEFQFGEILQEMEIIATHISIEFKSSIESAEMPAQVGSKLLLDDVSFGIPMGLFTLQTKERVVGMRPYPNPTVGRVAFDFPSNRFGYYRVFNSSGAQIAVREFSNTRQVVFNLMPYPAGKYLFQFHHNSGRETVRIIKN